MFARLSSSKPLRPILAIVLMALCVPALAIFSNGGFEAGDFTGWTVGGGSNPGLSGTPPFTGADININGSAVGPNSVVGNISDPLAPQLVIPREGSFTAKLNDSNGGSLVTTLMQTDTLASTDIDPGDGMPHIRFSFAPVLEDPGHSPDEQPYFYVQLNDVTAGTVLFQQFAYSGQPGNSFLNDGATAWKYLLWNNVDVTLPVSAIGHQIELTVIAADCSLGAHGGYVYVDGFGSAVIPPPPPIVPFEYTPVPVNGPAVLALLAALLGLFGWWQTRKRQRDA